MAALTGSHTKSCGCGPLAPTVTKSHDVDLFDLCTIIMEESSLEFPSTMSHAVDLYSAEGHSSSTVIWANLSGQKYTKHVQYCSTYCTYFHICAIILSLILMVASSMSSMFPVCLFLSQWKRLNKCNV